MARKTSMIHNYATPEIESNPETHDVRADAKLLVFEPPEKLPMALRARGNNPSLPSGRK
jgi:urease subunit alpha